MAELTQQSSEVKIRSRKLSTRIDMTPMVDLAFLLLTFFILTTRLLQPFAMKLEVPEENNIDAPPVNIEKVLTLMLGDDNKIYWYSADNPTQVTDFSSQGIRKVLLTHNNKIKNMVVLIKPSKDAAYRNIVDILDEMAIVDIKHYFLVSFTQQDEDRMKNLLAQSNMRE